MSTDLLERPAVAPDRSLAQRLTALERANDVRTRRARFKRDLKAGRVAAVDVLLNLPWWAETMKVGDFLMSVPKWGRVKTSKAVTRARISPSKTLGSLSDRQRQELAGALR